MTDTSRGIRADRTELLTARGRWEARGEELDAVRRALASAPVGGLGGRVAPAAGVVLDGWGSRAGELAEAARAHADALWSTWGALDATDGEAARVLGGSR